jgi:thiamine-triphosphatase
MAVSSARQIVLEVERKFSGLRVHPLRKNAGSPAFRQLEHLGAKSFRDVYFDYEQLLSKSGTWVRQRDGRWESKIRQAGDYNNSQFREVQDVDEIGRHVRQITHHTQVSSKDFGLTKIAELTTHREMWRADDRFKIVLDRTDFGHVVGEVELETEVAWQSESESRRLCAWMDSEIECFMQRYYWAFNSSPAVGKLTAYFARQH